MPPSSQNRATSAATSGAEDAPILDRAAMLATVEQDLELLRELVEIFLAESPALVGQVRAGLREGRLEQAEHAAHTLKGSVGNFGARRAAEAARALENEAREHNLDRAQSLLPALEEEIAHVCRALSDYLREVPL